MSKKAAKRPNKAKSIIAQPLFRSHQERPQKGKGSYRREASQNWEASCFMAPVKITTALQILFMRTGNTLVACLPRGHAKVATC